MKSTVLFCYFVIVMRNKKLKGNIYFSGQFWQVWDSDRECGKVPDNDIECGTVLDNNSEVWDSAGH